MDRPPRRPAPRAPDPPAPQDGPQPRGEPSAAGGPGASAPALERARVAAASVRARFGRRLLGLPGTYLPRVSAPGGPGRLGPWQYWWLAHFVDCLVDEADREQRAGDPARAGHAVTLAHRLLRTVRLRNGARFPVEHYDDMAWLLLAAGRLGQRIEGRRALRGPSRLAAVADAELAAALRRGMSPQGGVYWSTGHDFLAVAATGPAAIALARRGERDAARALVDWAYATVHDERTGLFADGLRRGVDGRWALVPDVYTYNQGTVLGALVELGDPVSAARAGALVAAVDRHLATGGVLVTHGGHDGGLFTGIAARYLARAARSPALPAPVRGQAAGLVAGTSEALWQGRRAEQQGRHAGVVFSLDPARPASQTLPPGTPVELSPQVQAWMFLEAAATLPSPVLPGPAPGDGPE